MRQKTLVLSLDSTCSNRHIIRDWVATAAGNCALLMREHVSFVACWHVGSRITTTFSLTLTFIIKLENSKREESLPDRLKSQPIKLQRCQLGQDEAEDGVDKEWK